jgi:hypothetical protein
VWGIFFSNVNLKPVQHKLPGRPVFQENTGRIMEKTLTIGRDFL